VTQLLNIYARIDEGQGLIQDITTVRSVRVYLDTDIQKEHKMARSLKSGGLLVIESAK